MSIKRWAVQTIPLERMNPAPYNPRVKLEPGDEGYESLKGSMEEFGCLEPIVWNGATGNIIGGHRRYDVLMAYGDTETDAVVVVEPDLIREKWMNLALNKISGRFDDELLRENLEELQEQVDLAVAGFNTAEVEELLDTAAKQDFITDLLLENFVTSNADPAYFQVSFTFEIRHKGMVEGYIKEHGKDSLTALILSHIEEAE